MTYPVGREEVPPLHQPYEPDDIPAFHAARLLLLIEVCGTGDRSRAIEGSTKLAKLDFFLRYPSFLARAHSELRARGEVVPTTPPGPASVEAPMIRYRFGPWDPRYRDYVAFLESRELLRVVRGPRNTRKLSLTSRGRKTAKGIMADPAYDEIGTRAEAMVGNLASWQGSQLKDFIYELLVDEVGKRQMGEVIVP